MIVINQKPNIYTMGATQEQLSKFAGKKGVENGMLFRLLPGPNEVDKEIWDEALKNPILKKKVDKKILKPMKPAGVDEKKTDLTLEEFICLGEDEEVLECIESMADYEKIEALVISAEVQKRPIAHSALVARKKAIDQMRAEAGANKKPTESI